MSNVIELPSSDKPGEDDGPHWSGECICGACGHEWHAVVPVGDEDHLECPKCHRWWGCAKNAVTPPDAMWRCNCGETLFWLTPEGAMCRRCGIISNDWADLA